MSDVLFSSALLRDVDARGREELMRAGREETYAAQAYAYRAGDDGDSVFVCIEGEFDVSVPSRADGASRHVRDVLRGDAFGEEAILPFSARQASAQAKNAAKALVLPAHLVRRALGRVGKEDHEARIRRTVERALIVEAIVQCTLFQDATDRERDAVVDASRVREVGRGEYLYREGESAKELFIVTSGTLSVTAEERGRPRVLAYVSRGDAAGDAEVFSGTKRKASLFALGPSRVVAVPESVIDRKKPGPMHTRLTIAAPDLLPTAHLFRDRHRFEVARSMLMIDADLCVRCGHCASACASVHDDGVSRLLRHGEVFDVPSLDARLIAPTSCQHCKNPACMPPCPTGAISREASGEVVIRAELCTGCGACEKACPWENIAMAPRGKNPAPPGLKAADLAVKCDLCAGRDHGPACVAACPVSAMVRIEPTKVIAELGGTPSAADLTKPRKIPLAAYAIVFGAFLLCARFPIAFVPSGVVTATVLLMCVLYMLWKRVAFRFSGPHGVRSVATGYAIHLGLGAALPGLALGHAHAHVHANAAGLAFGALMIACATGALLVMLQRAVPPVLSRTEGKTSDDRDTREQSRALGAQLVAAVSQKSALAKVLFERVIGPYDRALFAGFRFAVAGKSQREERASLTKAIDVLLEGRGKDKRAELDEMVRVVTERRALAGKRGAIAILRGVVVAHVLAVFVTLSLVVMHVVGALR